MSCWARRMKYSWFSSRRLPSRVSPFSGIGEDQVDVRGEVELFRAKLAKREDHQRLRGPVRAVRYAEALA